jgi:hypothetical protein
LQQNVNALLELISTQCVHCAFEAAVTGPIKVNQKIAFFWSEIWKPGK